MKEIITSADGSVKVSINQSLLLSALTIDTDGSATGTSLGSAGNIQLLEVEQMINDFCRCNHWAAYPLVQLMLLSTQKHLRTSPHCVLRMVRRCLVYNSPKKQPNKDAQILRLPMDAIMDVDIAAESTALAKHTILVQASASMLSQAKSECKYSTIFTWLSKSKNPLIKSYKTGFSLPKSLSSETKTGGFS